MFLLLLTLLVDASEMTDTYIPSTLELFYYVRSKSASHSISCLQLLLLICCFYNAPSLMSARHMTGAVVEVLVFTGYVYISLILQKSL